MKKIIAVLVLLQLSVSLFSQSHSIGITLLALSGYRSSYTNVYQNGTGTNSNNPNSIRPVLDYLYTNKKGILYGAQLGYFYEPTTTTYQSFDSIRRTNGNSNSKAVAQSIFLRFTFGKEFTFGKFALHAAASVPITYNFSNHTTGNGFTNDSINALFSHNQSKSVASPQISTGIYLSPGLYYTPVKCLKIGLELNTGIGVSYTNGITNTTTKYLDILGNTLNTTVSTSSRKMVNYYYGFSPTLSVLYRLPAKKTSALPKLD